MKFAAITSGVHTLTRPEKENLGNDQINEVLLS